MSIATASSAATAMRWLASHGVSTSRVVAESISGAGIGLAARSAVAAGEAVLRIPRAVWWPLSAEAARERAKQRMPEAHERVEALVESLGAGQSKHLADSALLAAHLAQQVLDDGDPNLYLRQLPVALDIPLLWPAPLRSVLLHGTSSAAACESQAALSEVLYDALDGGRGLRISKGQFRWGQALLLSRAHSGEGKPFALVPGLDLLNHGGAAAAGAEVRFDAPSGAFELIATRPHRPGEELLIDYGVRGSHRLLRRYGFVPGAATDVPSNEAGAAREVGALAAEEEVALLVPPPAQASGADDAPSRAANTAMAGADDATSQRQQIVPADEAGVTVPLRWLSLPTPSSAGKVDLGLPPTARPGSNEPAAAAALESSAKDALLAAIDRRLDAHLPGYEGCDAVQQLRGESAGDVAARRRAYLCQLLHEREVELLLAARRQLSGEHE